jgi:hypothetical protein
MRLSASGGGAEGAKRAAASCTSISATGLSEISKLSRDNGTANEAVKGVACDKTLAIYLALTGMSIEFISRRKHPSHADIARQISSLTLSVEDPFCDI